MHRTLFDRYEIKDQNHDFLISKAYFVEALREHIVAEFFKSRMPMALKESIPDPNTFSLNIPSSSSDDYYNMLLLTTHEESINNRTVKRDVELLYFPNISMSTKTVDISLYHVSLLESKIDFDLDKIFYSIRKRLKQRKIDCKATTVFDTKKMLRQVINHIDIGKLEILILNKDTFDIVWEIISILENDFLRNIEISDFKS